MEKGVFAYRLPNEKHVQIFEGRFELVDTIFIPSSNQIIISSFDKKQLVLFNIENQISEIELNRFNFFSNQIQEETSFDNYSKSFNQCLDLLNKKEVNKIVLSRIKTVTTKKNPTEIFEEMNRLYLNTCNYLFSSELTGTWLGATPELLLNAAYSVITSVSLAGTKIATTEWTKKELVEQEIVTDFILEKFAKVGVKEIESSKPETVNAGNIQHLKSLISGKFSSEQEILELINELHPTPATCGLPQKLAARAIQQIEKHKRLFYTGFIGFNNNDHLNFYVNLRCMQFSNRTAQLFIGGGLLIDSKLESEWLETERKAQTLEKIIAD